MTRLAARRLGRADVQLSPICFGTMRLHERAYDDDHWTSLFAASLDLGITTFHSSSEYESYAQFRALLGRMDRTNLQHVVKLGEPHFGEFTFSRDRLRAKVEAYLTELRTERLDVIQWMWRGDLKDEAGRLAGFDRDYDELLRAFDELRTAGKIGAVAPFPYTGGFADAFIARGGFEGLSVYLNPLEREMVPQIERAADAGMGTIAIRPLAAGKALGPTDPGVCLRDVVAQRGVTSAVVGYSSREHLAGLVRAQD